MTVLGPIDDELEMIYDFCWGDSSQDLKFRTVAIFYPLFEDHFFIFKEVPVYGQYSRAVSNQEGVMMARVQY